MFAAAILAVLWLLQTVFLQNFYDHMAIENVQETVEEIVLHQQDTELSTLLDRLAYENALLIFLTDREGNLIYSTDEHSGVYGGGGARQSSGERPSSMSARRRRSFHGSFPCAGRRDTA